MNTYLFDTNICIFLLNQKHGFENIINKMDGVDRKQISISAISVAELEFGIAASYHQHDNSNRLDRFLINFEISPFDQDAAKPYGLIRHHLKSQGTPIGPLDFLIAAHALALNSILITNNTKEFNRVPNLSVEDWSI